MAKPFKGTINIDIRDSEPDWTPFEPPVAPDGAPNVLYVGRNPGEPVTEDYPGGAPHSFTGGTINRIAIDVSGEPYQDLEREAALMLMRE